MCSSECEVYFRMFFPLAQKGGCILYPPPELEAVIGCCCCCCDDCASTKRQAPSSVKAMRTCERSVQSAAYVMIMIDVCQEQRKTVLSLQQTYSSGIKRTIFSFICVSFFICSLLFVVKHADVCPILVPNIGICHQNSYCSGL